MAQKVKGGKGGRKGVRWENLSQGKGIEEKEEGKKGLIITQ